MNTSLGNGTSDGHEKEIGQISAATQATLAERNIHADAQLLRYIARRVEQGIFNADPTGWKAALMRPVKWDDVSTRPYNQLTDGGIPSKYNFARELSDGARFRFGYEPHPTDGENGPAILEEVWNQTIAAFKARKERTMAILNNPALDPVAA